MSPAKAKPVAKKAGYPKDPPSKKSEASDELKGGGEADYEESPEGQARRWTMELEAADAEVRKWHESGQRIVERFRDTRDTTNSKDKRLNLFTSSTQTKRDMMYGKTPEVDVSRRFSDAPDDDARVAAELIKRVLNRDVERDGDGYRSTLRHALLDRLIPGLGMATVRYVAEWEDVEAVPAQLHPKTGAVMAEEVPAYKRKVFEDVETDWIFWKDFRWAAGTKVWPPRWAGFAVEMSRKSLVKRFGEEGRVVPLNAGPALEGKKDHNPWGRALVWEIYDREHKCTYWVVKGHKRILDKKEDKDGLTGFFPFPEPLLANTTTDTLVPRPDFAVCQNQYDSIDNITTRTDDLIDCVRAAGTYDKSAAPELAGILTGKGPKMIPATNFAALAEKGGLRGVMDFLPLDVIVNAITVLRDYRREQIDLLFQVSGDSDVMRGQQTENGTPGEAQVKAKFGSVRMQARQDEFAKFASDLQRIRAELICRHFDDKTILERANAQFMPKADQARIPAALQILRSRFADYRIEVKPESVALSDFAALKSESMEVLEGIARFFAGVGQMAQDPTMRPMLFEVLQWSLSRVRGAQSIEGVIDQAIEAANKAAEMAKQQGAPPDPKVVAAQMKQQSDMQKTQADMAKVDKELQADVVRSQLAMREAEHKERMQAQYNVQEAAQKQLVSNALKPPEMPHGFVRPGGPR